MEHNKLMKIFPLLLQSGESGNTLKVMPSVFMREMKFSTGERIAKLLQWNRNFLTEIVNKTFPCVFKPSLPIVIFQNFTPENVYNVSISILNSDKIARSLTLTCNKSPYFSVCYNSKAIIKVAPGISEKLMIRFSPTEKKDYHHNVTFKCEDGSFDIPIFAIGPRPLLDFPDDIHFTKCPVKVPVTKVVCVFNVGELDAVFTLSTKSPFQVQPRNCLIKSGENLQVSVVFDSSKVGNFEEFIKINFESGEILYCKVNATAESSVVVLNTERLNFEDTFAGLSRQKVMSIHNYSSHVVNYRWMNFPNQKEDNEVALRLENYFSDLCCKDNHQVTEQIAKETMNSSSNKKLPHHGFSCIDFQHDISENEFLFNHPNFAIDPIKGDIWPRSSVDVQITFKPDAGPRIYDGLAFCETSGCEERHSLQLHGLGLGPNIVLTLHILDIGKVYAKMKNSYEIVVANKGDISGQIEYISTKLDYGGIMECMPKYYKLEPGEHKAFALSFVAKDRGDFIEEVIFKISESNETRKLILKGYASYGKLEIDKECIDFGNLPLGFPVTSDVAIHNPSPVPIIFNAYIAGKGTAEQNFSDLNHSNSSNIFDELSIEPKVGCIEPNEIVNATIKVNPRAPKKFFFQLVVEMWNGITNPLIIPITYKTVVPEIKYDPSEIYFSLCFINYPYIYRVQLTNPTEYPARYLVLSQEATTYESITMLPDVREGIINPSMTVSIRVSLMVHKVGKFSTLFKVKVFGLENILITKIIGEGQGPIVTSEFESLDWERRPIFTRDITSFQLYNHSPIPADFSCELVKSYSPWKIHPLNGIIAPKDEVTISVELYLLDDGHFYDDVKITIQNSDSLSVALSVICYGTSITTDPTITPFLDFGYIFCSSWFNKEIIFKNNGRKPATILLAPCKRKAGVKLRELSLVFEFYPEKLVLNPGQCQSIFIQARHRRVEEVKESFLFWKTDGEGKRQKIFEGYVKASFIKLHLNFSTKSLDFLSYKKQIVQETLIVRNDTSLSTTSIVSAGGIPFRLVKGKKFLNNMEINLPSHEDVEISIQFNPSIFIKNRSTSTLGMLTFNFRNTYCEYEVQLNGDVIFPHLLFEVHQIDFGCIYTGNISKRVFKITNDSPSPIKFEWKWIESSVTVENVGVSENVALEGKDQNLDLVEFSMDIFDGLLRYMEKDKQKFINLMHFPELTYYLNEEEDLFKFLTMSVIENKNSLPISWVFDVMPNHGELDANSSMEVSILFRGYVSLEAFASLTCAVIGGSSDSIYICGKSSTISYFLDKTYIDFKERIFCQMCHEKIEIRNTGPIDFYFKSDSKELVPDVSNFNQNFQPCSLMLEPNSGCVPCYSSVTLKVYFYPGKFGPLKSGCVIEIPGVEPIHIDVEAYGILPQVFTHLPKDLSASKSMQLIPDLEYIGIANMNEDWMMSKLPLTIDWDMFTNSDTSAFNETDWVMVLYEDAFPTVSEISLAVEKQIATHCISGNFDFMPLNQKRISIPGFVTTPNLLDMGFVLIGEESTCTVLLENCGAISAQLRVLKESKENMAKAGFAISLSNGNDLQVKKMAELYITIFPTKEIYPYQHHDIDITMYIDVIYGARIPIRVLAEATIPLVMVHVENLNFGSVKCGQCKVLLFTLTNSGWIDCVWEVSLVPLKKKPLAKKNQTPAINKKPEEQIEPFSIAPLKGKLIPGEERTLKVLFQPSCHGVFKRQIVIKVDKNTTDIVLNVKGTGLDPILKFNPSEISFNPIMPSIEQSKNFILIKNPNNYPVEIFLPAFDRQIVEEELTLRLLLHYYEAEDLMIPVRGVGEELPKEFKDFFQWMIDMLWEEFQKQNQNVAVVEKTVKAQRRSKPLMSRTRKSSSSSAYEDKIYAEKNENLTDKDQLAFKEMAINNYLSGGIKLPAIEKNKKDPIKCLMDRLARLSEEESLNCRNSFTSSGTFRQASVFIFHGAPFSDHVQIAHRASQFLELPIINIDDVLLKEVVLGSSLVGSELKKTLLKKMNEFFVKFQEAKEEKDLLLHSRGTNIPISTEKDESAVEEFSNRLATYLSNCGSNVPASTTFIHMKDTQTVPNVKSTKSFLKSKSEAPSNQSDKSGHTVLPPKPVLWLDLPHNVHFPNIPEYLIEEILSMRLQQPDCLHGFVIPTLKSVFFQSLESALKSLLKLTYGTYSVECIFIHNSFEQHIDVLKERKELKEARENILKESKIENSSKTDNANIDGKLLLLDEKYNCCDEPDAYLMKIKEKFQEIRKFSKILEFAESELEKELSEKKAHKYKVKNRSSGNVASATVMKSKSSKRSMVPSISEGIKSSKKGLHESKSRIGKIASSQKSRYKSIKSDNICKLQPILPFSEAVLSATDLEAEKALDLWNQFDNYNSLLVKLLSILESWPMRLEKRVSERHNISSDLKVRPFKLSRKSSPLMPDITSSKDLGSYTSKLGDFLGIPVMIVNSPNIDSLLVKGFFDTIVPQTSPMFYHHTEVSEVKSINDNATKLSDVTYLHIKKSWFDRVKEAVESAFTIKSVDCSGLSISQDMQEIIQGMESMGSFEPPLFEPEKYVPTIIEEGENKDELNSDDGKSGKRAKNRRGTIKKNKERKKLHEKGIEARRVLQPGETVAYCVCYHPQEKGTHNSYLTVELTDWQRSYPIKICGISDLPAIDFNPNSIFSKCAQEKPMSPSALYPPTYFYDIEALDFGLLSVEKNLDEQYTCAVSKLTFHNTSHVNVQAKFNLECGEVRNFTIDKENLEIKSKDVGFISVKANPKYPLQVDGTLVCSMNNNSDEVRIKLTCVGYKPEVELAPKQLNFDRVLLYRREKHQLVLKNNCAASFYWRVSSKDFIEGDDFDVVPNTGFLSHFSSVPIEVEFIASRVQVIFKKPLCVEFFNDKEDPKALLSGTALVTAESYDVLIDIRFAHFGNNSGKKSDCSEESEQPNHLNFGLMKAASRKKMLISLGNVGKYDVHFEFIKSQEYSKDEFGNNLFRIFKLNPMSGILKNVDKTQAAVEVECFPNIEVEMNNIPLYICRIVDSNVTLVEQSTVANFPIHVSLKSIYSKFAIFPYPELNFGALKIYSEETLTFTICNQGKFDFTFSLAKSCQHYYPDKNKEDVSLASTRKELRKKESVDNNLEIGCFTISPCMGTISVDEIVTITVHCFPEFEGNLKEIIDIIISDTPSGSKIEFDLSVTSCIPSINYSNPEKIFIEHIICEDFSVFKWPSKLTKYTVYSKEDNELAFKNVFVGSTLKARLSIQNTSLVYTKVKVSIQPLTEGWKVGCQYHNQVNSASCVSFQQFSVKPTKVKIPPCSDKWITISFTPAAMEVYCALLAISVDEEGGDEDCEEDIVTEEDIELEEDIVDEKEGESEEEEETGEDNGKKRVGIKDWSKKIKREERKVEGDEGGKEDEEESKGGEVKAFRGRESVLSHILEKGIGENEEAEEIGLEEDEVKGKGKRRESEEESEDGTEIEENSSSWFCLLSGEGLLPELTLTHPSELTKGPNGKYSIIIPPLHVQNTKRLKVGFQNTGCIYCKVVIEFNGDGDFFQMIPTEESERLISKLKANVPLKNITTVELKPMEELTFWFYFYAKAPAAFMEEICVTPIGNPFGLIIISVDAVCTEEGIIIEGLDYVKKQFYTLIDPADDCVAFNNKVLSTFCANLDFDNNADTSPKNKPSNSSVKVLDPAPEIVVFSRNLLDFKDVYVGQLKVVQFRLVNHSQISYAYEWIGLKSIPQIALFPNKGVLKSLSHFIVTAVFSSNKPLYIPQALLKCHLKRVIPVNEIYVNEDYHVMKDNDQLSEGSHVSFENEETPEEENIMKLIEHNKLINELRRGMFLEESKSQNTNKTKSILQENTNNDIEETPKIRFQLELSGRKDNEERWQIYNSVSEDISGHLDDKEENELVLPVIIRAVADYASYSCDIMPEIEFKWVAVGLSKSYNVTLTNVGKVPFKFRWKFFNNLSEKKYKNVRIKQYRKTHLKIETARTNKSFKAAFFVTRKKYIGVQHLQKYNPFSVLPKKGKLPPNGGFSVCKITFSPARFGSYKAWLVCSINNLAPRKCGPRTLVKGKAKWLPYYFNYEQLKLSRSERRKPFHKELKARPLSSDFVLHPKTDTTEIHMIGVGHTYLKTLDFYNFTRKDAVFNWKNMNLQEGGVLEWTCCKPAGVARPKSITPMTFEFTPSKIGLFESLWSFSVYGDGKTNFPLFHLVGIASEPAIYFLDGCIKMNLTYAGLKSGKNTFLVNDEEIPLRFRVDSNACSLENKNGKMKINPMKGVLKPKSKTLIRATYFPQQTGITCFHVTFLIERRPSPLVLTINCGSYELLPEVVLCIPPNSTKITLTSNEANDVNFGEIRERTAYQRFFKIHNKGNQTFHYTWCYNEDLAKQIGLSMCFSHVDGCVLPSSTVACSLTLCVLRKSRIENFKVDLKISQGPIYIIYLSMVANGPKSVFSFKSYDFGKCLVSPIRANQNFKEVILTIKGKDKNAIMLESKFHCTDYVVAHLKKTVLLFNEEVKVPIRFCPKELVKYKEKIPFIINGEWEKSVVIRGEGIPLMLELVNPDQKCISFKSIRVGSRVSKIISVKNRTSKTIDVSFRLSSKAKEEYSECSDSESSSYESLDDESLHRSCIEIFPKTEVTLKHGDVVDLHVTFFPSVKMADFSEKIVAIVRDFEEETPLCVVNGSTRDLDVSLTTYCLQFGPIVKDSTAVSSIALVNIGDEGAEYKWDPDGKLDPQFSITPTSGFCCPGQSVAFRVAFTPTRISKCVECKIICQLKGQEDMTLDLSGRGIELPPIEKTLTFSAPVRESESKIVVVTNRSDDIIEVRPILKGDYFRGADVVMMKPSSDAMYRISYAPMTLTKEDKKHCGILYLHLPDGEEYSWNLVGTTNPPLVSSQIKQKVQCKIPHLEILTVHNWLPIPQRFHVTTELIPGKDGEPTFLITGYVKMHQQDGSIKNSTDNRGGIKNVESKKKLMEKSLEKGSSIFSDTPQSSNRIGGDGEPGGYLDVPANGFSQYKIKFVCYEECSLDFKVIFTNEDTSEYLYHEISFTVVECQTPIVIEINTKVRRKTAKKLDLENPLSSISLNFSLTTKLDFISVPEAITLAPKTKETVTLHCFPLKEGYFTAPLLISCPELGVFPYELKVNVKPLNSKEYKEFLFTASLGSFESISTPLLLHNYAQKTAEFICKANSPAFLVEKHVVVSPQDAEELDVIFEPTTLGKVHATLSCTSEVAGSFFFKLKGICNPPKTQGPYVVLANSKGTCVLFKNVFTKVTRFTLEVTDPFELESYSKILGPKEEMIINVSFTVRGKELAKNPLPVTGSLVVSLTDEVPRKTKWEYYLKGAFK